MNISPASNIPERRAAPPVALSLAVCFAATAFMAWMRLGVYPDRIFPLSSGLPLLICLWTRDRRMLYGMAVVFTAITAIKVNWDIPEASGSPAFEWVLIASQMVNIWLVAGVIHGLLGALDRIERRNLQLAASNEELAAREEEISRQNEELQSQTEELEQQAEELRQQAEEMELQTAEIQDANDELVRKERGMQTLLDSGRWLRADMNESLVMNGVCQAAVQVLGEGVEAAVVLEAVDGVLELRGDFGFGISGLIFPHDAGGDSFASLTMEIGRTACIEDLAVRPELKLPRPDFRTVLGSPIWRDGRAAGVLEIYGKEPRQWTDHEFRVTEWLAAQAALGLQTIHTRHELDRKRQAAEEASIQKTRFLAAVSHDVRTPANAISLLAEFIQRCAGDPERLHQIPGLAKNLWSNARAMVDLVSDVLDITRFDSGGLDLNVTDFSLGDLIRSEIQQARPQAENKGIKLKCLASEKEIHLRSDRTKLARVLGNLIGNAVKFTDAGEVRVEFRATGDGGARIEVIDTGVGIPAEHIRHVFDEFFQLRNPERNREKGAGLGLAICRRLLDGLGFEVNVTSLLGIGSTFSVIIPPSRVIAGSTTPVEPGVAGSLDGLHFLLVEDHQTAREITAELLTDEGARVCTAANGRDAVRHLASGLHDVLLLDLNLPDFDGSEILRSIQASRPGSLRWILVVSGDVRPERIAQVKQLGAHGLIPKPVCVDKIRAALREHGHLAPAR